ncbi:MAG: ABC transporter ATP-binding protein [bacterium]|nr:ABC transporter ATP-binding protein [bacterium]
MIEINNMSFSYNKNEILRNISLSVENGEIVGIIGSPGSGKTILLRILAGYIKGYTGEIVYNSTPLNSFSKKKLHQDISHLDNEMPENLEDSVRNFLLLSRMPYKRMLNPFSEYDIQVTEEYIKQFGLESIEEAALNMLPESSLAMTRLAHAFIREANLLFLDNPTTGLGIPMYGRLKKILSKYVLNGERTIICCSNDINFISQTADRILILHEGSIAEQGSPDIIDADLIKKYFKTEVLISRNIYNGKPEIHFFPEG